MASYIEKHTTVTKDTLNVDHNSRETFLHVKFLNPSNIYYGLFSSNKFVFSVNDIQYDLGIIDDNIVLSNDNGISILLKDTNIKNNLTDNTVAATNAIPSLSLISTLNDDINLRISDLSRDAAKLAGDNKILGTNTIEQLSVNVLSIDSLYDVILDDNISLAEILANLYALLSDITNLSNVISDEYYLRSETSSALEISNAFYTKTETDNAINKIAAYYITKNSAGDAFSTYNELSTASKYYSGGQIRIPTRNDYAVVLSDETHNDSEYRYIFTAPEENNENIGQWEPQYPIETNDYATLSNIPKINNVPLSSGNIDLNTLGIKGLLTKVDDPTTNGTAINFITSLSLDINGVIYPKKSAVLYATKNLYGVVQITESIDDTSTDHILSTKKIKELSAAIGNCETKDYASKTYATKADLTSHANNGRHLTNNQKTTLNNLSDLPLSALPLSVGTARDSILLIVAGNTNPSSNGYAEASEARAIALGYGAKAKGKVSFVTNNACSAITDNTFAAGYHTIAKAINSGNLGLPQFVHGIYNCENTNAAYIVGIGSGDAARQNGFEIDLSGKTYVLGVGNYNGTNSNDANVYDIATVINKSLLDSLTIVKYIDGTLSAFDITSISEPNLDALKLKNACEIKLGTNIESIRARAFTYCTNISSVTIPNTIKANSIGNYAFYSCTNLQNVIIGNSISAIEEYAFYDCSLLKNILIGNNVKYIGNSAFSNCTNLTNILLPDSITHIDQSAFYYCYSLKDITLSKNLSAINYHTFSTCTSLTKLTIPNSVIDIGQGAFNQCVNLSSIILPNSIKSLGRLAFHRLDSLSTLIIPSSVNNIDINSFNFGDNDNPNLSVYFENRTIEEVESLDNYPWNLSAGINLFAMGKNATLEWVEDQHYLKADSTELNDYWKKDDDLSADMISAISDIYIGDSSISNKLDEINDNIPKLSVDNVEVKDFKALRISQDDYYELVINDNCDPHTLYIVSSDNINAYGEKIENVADATDLSDAVPYGLLTTILNDYAKSDDLTAYAKSDDLSDYALLSVLDDYVLTNDLSDYVLTDELTNYALLSTLNNVWKKTDSSISSSHIAAKYVSDIEPSGVELDSLGYVKITNWDIESYESINNLTILTNYLKLGHWIDNDPKQIDYEKIAIPFKTGTLALLEDLSDYAKSDDLSDYVLTNDLSDYARKSDVLYSVLLLTYEDDDDTPLFLLSNYAVLYINLTDIITMINNSCKFNLPAISSDNTIVYDFIVDIYNARTSTITIELNNWGINYSVIVNETDDIIDILTINANSKARLYFTLTSFKDTNTDQELIPVWHIAKQNITITTPQ